MASTYRRHATVTDYDETHSQSTGDLPLSIQHYEEQQQIVEYGEANHVYDESHHPRGHEHYHRPYLQDHRANTYDASYGRRPIEWPGFGQTSGAEVSQQLIQPGRSKVQSDGDDELSDEHEDNHYKHGRRQRQRSGRNQEQLWYKEPPIAKFVRSEAQRRSSSGRSLFSPSGLQDSQKAVTRYDAVEFPLLPMSKQHMPDSLSHAAYEFAHIRSGELWKCVKFLEEHDCLLREDYHPYIQEAWIALWDGDKHYAHQCLSRWYLLDECRQIWPVDIARHIIQRSFSGDRFMDKVDAMYNMLKDLRRRILNERKQGARSDLEDRRDETSTWSFKGVQGFFQGVNRATVLSNVGNIYRFVTEARREFQGSKKEVKIQI